MTSVAALRPESSLPPPETDSGYVVRPGDTLSAIAEAHGVSLSALERANPQIADPNLIRPGEHVTIPAAGEDARGASGGVYTVQSGDTLSGIGQRFGVDWRILAQLNGLSNPNLIQPGEQIRLGPTASGGGTSAASGAGSTAGAGSAPGSAAGGPSGSGSLGEREQQAVSYFEGQGWSHAQAAGIVANLVTESGLSPSAVGDGGLAYGLAQWHPDRQAGFQAFTGHGIQGSSFGQQLAYVNYELTHSEAGAGRALRGAGDAADAGSIVSRDYERPADASGQAAQRAALAQQIFARTN